MDSGAANRKGFPQVGFAGEGTVNRAQGIASKVMKPYLKEMVAQFFLQPIRVAPRRIDPSPLWVRGFLFTIWGRLYVLPNIRRG